MTARGSFEVEGWRVEPDRGALTPAGGGEPVRLEPRVMDLLVTLAASGGRVLSKDELIATVWEGRAIGDDTLAAAVSRLRSALGETHERRYIETVPKRGYRWALETPAIQRPERTRAGPLIDQGRAALRFPLPPNLAQARLSFETAIAEDPTSAAGQAGLADTLLLQQFMGLAPGAAALAKTAAAAATGLDAGSPEAWAALGTATLLADRDFEAADRALLRAISLDPGAAAPHRTRAFALSVVGRFVEAEREARAAVEADPVSLPARSVLFQVLLLAKRYRPVIADAKRVLELAPAAGEAWTAKGWAHHFLGEDAEAAEAFARGLQAWGVDKAVLDRLGEARARGGMEAQFAAAADLFESQTMMFKPRPLDVAMLRAAAGQADEAFAALDRAIELDDPYLLALPWLPHLDRLRNDYRFAAVLDRVRLVC